MTWVIVQRGSGEFRGPPIENELITEDYVAIERGRNELDNSSSDIKDVTMTTIYRSGVRLGQVVRVLDSLQGLQWFGKIVGIRHRQSSILDTETILNIERGS